MLAERAATWPKQWMAEGFEKGWREGWLDGQRLALSKQVEAKFGVLGARHQTAIADASEEQLRQWLKDILTAGEPSDLFRR